MNYVFLNIINMSTGEHIGTVRIASFNCEVAWGILDHAGWRNFGVMIRPEDLLRVAEA